MAKLGDLLHMERRRRKLNLRELSNHVGLSPIYISEIETGRKIPLTGDSLIKLAQFYELDPAELTKLAFQDKSEERVQEVQNKTELAIARKNNTESLLKNFLEKKDVPN